MSDTVTTTETPSSNNDADSVNLSSTEVTTNLAEESTVPLIMDVEDASNNTNSTESNGAHEQNPDKPSDSDKNESGFVRPAYIPPHLMGRDLNNPALDMIGTGRRVQKPRLGVKVPYRNLTSQIVSQDEIAQEILERSLRKYSYTDVPEGGDVFFAMKLTHRLANKINSPDGAAKAEKKTASNKTPDIKNSVEKEKRPKKSSIVLPKAAPIKDDSQFNSKAEELYAEISSTLKEDCKLTQSVKGSSSLNSTPKKVVNGSAASPTEQELDNDTLLAILEGTNDINDSVVTSASEVETSLVVDTSIAVDPLLTPSAAVSPSSTPKADTFSAGKRKRRIKPILDPNVEKELALKQLMDFETKKSMDRMKRMIKKPKTDEEGPNTNENKLPDSEADKKNIKRTYSLGSAPKRFPKKYQRIIKRQLRSSKLKAKSLSPDQPQKKLPEVPEVQIAIDKYIKTYTNKRKHKPEASTPEKPVEKKTKETEKFSGSSQVQEDNNVKHQEVQVEVDSADENRNEADISDQEAKKDEGTPKPKANSKVMREINRLLGDEGAINMIYSIEHKRIPGNKNDSNASPSIRCKKDLLLKTKLVKNAVLRLSMSSSQTSPGRGRRSSPEAPKSPKSSTSALRKASVESAESSTSEISSPKVRKVAAEASKIIRRHSSSSAYSSDEEEPSGSTVTNGVRKESTATTPTPTTSTAANVASVPSAKKSTQNDVLTDKAISLENISVDPKSNEIKGKSAKASSSRRASKEDPSIDSKYLDDRADVLNGPNVEIFEQISLKEITIRKYDNLVQVILISSSPKMKNALNAEVLREFTKVLNDLQKDDKCRIVLVTSTGSSFCQGIDLQALICTDKKDRSKIVSEYLHALTEFTKCLSQFHKLLIAGVHGSAVGLGVTMLPFFDMVYASDKATFYTPYVRLGQIPEAGATLTLPHLLGNAVTSELLFGCRMLTASEALQFGLVTRVLWPDKFNEELLPLSRSIAGHSSQSMEATKKLLRQAMNVKLQEQLETEAKLLQEHWCSDECQNLFEKYLQEEAILQNK